MSDEPIAGDLNAYELTKQTIDRLDQAAALGGPPSKGEVMQELFKEHCFHPETSEEVIQALLMRGEIYVMNDYDLRVV